MAGQRDLPDNLNVRRHDTVGAQVSVTSKSILGIDLGALRRLVEAAEGLADKSYVTFEGLHRSAVYVDRYHATEIHVKDEVFQ